jgi:hypothetical protein
LKHRLGLPVIALENETINEVIDKNGLKIPKLL